MEGEREGGREGRKEGEREGGREETRVREGEKKGVTGQSKYGRLQHQHNLPSSTKTRSEVHPATRRAFG